MDCFQRIIEIYPNTVEILVKKWYDNILCIHLINKSLWNKFKINVSVRIFRFKSSLYATI